MMTILLRSKEKKNKIKNWQKQLGRVTNTVKTILANIVDYSLKPNASSPIFFLVIVS